MKNILPIFILFLFSCKSTSNKDITISPSLNIKDSLLVLNIRNNSDRDYAVEFPALDNFFYKDQYEESSPENLRITKSFEAIDDKIDIDLNKENQCFSLKNEFGEVAKFKFVNKKSQKIYYLKIKNYRKGETIIFTDDGFDAIYNIAGLKNKDVLLSKIKIQSCGKYEYFTGSFEFIPKQIILP